MSDCARCVHTYLSGNCVLGCDQTFTIIENGVIISSLETDCPHFVLSGRVNDSIDSVNDSIDSVNDSSDSAKDSSTKFEILRVVVVGLFGACTASVSFCIEDKVPTLDFITFLFCVMFIISAIIYAYESPVDNDQDQDGDDQ